MPRLPTAMVVATLVLACLVGCTQLSQSAGEDSALAQMLTIPPEVAATLTAWPTAPPVVTRPATPTAGAQPLWEAGPRLQPVGVQKGTTISTSDADVTPAAAAETGEPARLINSGVGSPLGSGSPPIMMRVPALGLEISVQEVSWHVLLEDGKWRSEWDTVDGAAGHHRDSANPGEAGNVVLSGHHNTKGEVFRQISEIGLPVASFGVGDEIVLLSQDGREHTYSVVSWDRFPFEIISEAQQREYSDYLSPTQEATLTLITCWPYESNSHRVVVLARLMP